MTGAEDDYDSDSEGNDTYDPEDDGSDDEGYEDVLRPTKAGRGGNRAVVRLAAGIAAPALMIGIFGGGRRRPPPYYQDPYPPPAYGYGYRRRRPGCFECLACNCCANMACNGCCGGGDDCCCCCY